jgi:hypothetical protein
LSGPEVDRLFCGEITDRGDFIDVTMTKNYISDAYPEIVRGFQLARLTDAAASLVRSPWAREMIARLADSLIKHTILGADEIYQLVSPPVSSTSGYPEVRPATKYV